MRPDYNIRAMPPSSAEDSTGDVLIETPLILFLFAFGMGVSFGVGFAVTMWLMSKVVQL